MPGARHFEWHLLPPIAREDRAAVIGGEVVTGGDSAQWEAREGGSRGARAGRAVRRRRGARVDNVSGSGERGCPGRLQVRPCEVCGSVRAAPGAAVRGGRLDAARAGGLEPEPPLRTAPPPATLEHPGSGSPGRAGPGLGPGAEPSRFRAPGEPHIATTESHWGFSLSLPARGGEPPLEPAAWRGAECWAVKGEQLAGWPGAGRAGPRRRP